ncbi:MAG: YhfC family glutamic-type intramembrane protease [Myxococcota bacterium]
MSSSTSSTAAYDVEAAIRGDREAFGRLVVSHANLVCGIVLAVVRDVEASEDVAQEVFVQAWRGIGKLRRPDSFRGWLRQLARNRAADHLRGHVRRRDLLRTAARDGVVDTTAPDEALLARERADILDDALEQLPDDAREVLVLFYREGHSVQQVAELLELREPTVRKRLSRARAQLKEDVLGRLSDHLVQTAPGAAFVLGVSAAIAAAAPSTAAAATGTALGTTAHAAAAGAALGTGLGLLGIFAGYRGGVVGARTDDERRQLRLLALTNAVAAVLSGIAFVTLEPVTGVGAAMAVLLGTLWVNQLVWLPRILAPRFAAECAEDPVEAPRRRHRQWALGFLGLLGGTALGLGGAVGGLVLAGRVSALAAALGVQAVGFVAIPLVLWLVVPPWLGVPRSRVLLGTVSWWLAVPLLVGVPWAAAQVLGSSPLVGAVALSLAAGLGEETMRALVYRWVQRRRPDASPGEAVVLGLGHGGIEAVLFGMPAVFGVIALATGTPLPDGSTMAPWGHVLLGVSRVALLVVHVGLTLLVWRAVAAWRSGRSGGGWFALAVAAHVALDLAAFALPVVLPDTGLLLGGMWVALTTLAAAALVVRGVRDAWLAGSESRS